jgi:predicted transcriptional regulator
LKIGAPTISHHVKELEHAGLIVTQRQGKLLTARVNPDTLALVQQFFATASP